MPAGALGPWQVVTVRRARWGPVTSPAGPARARRGVAVLAAGALAVAVLAGCGSSADARSRPAGQGLGRALRAWSRFPARLPPGPATAGGFQVISAQQAVALFRSAAATGPPAGIRLTATRMRLGTGVFVTDRGLRRLPAWQFGFAGVRGPAAVLAVAAA
jgi:hypothetical protein